MTGILPRRLPASERARDGLCLLGIAAVGVLVFGRAVGFDYILYDDQQLLVGQRAYLADPAHLVTTFVEDAFAPLGPRSAGVFYRPVLLVSYIADTLLGGGRPAVYHATNVLLHLAASALVFALLRRLGTARGLSGFLALAFCLHPALVSVPVWLPCRNESLLACFVALSVMSLLDFLRGRGMRGAAGVWLGFALALFTKETAVVLAGVLPLIGWFERRPEEGLSRRLALLALGCGAVLIAWLALRELALVEPRVSASGLGANLFMLVGYVGKSLLPIQLSGLPHARDVALAPGIASASAIVLAAAWAGRRLWGLAGIGLAWYAAFLAPTLLGHAETSGFEHRLYLPVIGLLIFAADLLPRAVARLPRAVPAVVAVAILLLLAGLSARRIPDYADDLSFWASVTRSSPHAELGWETLAFRSLEHQRATDAEWAARRLLELDPDSPDGQLALGVALAKQGRFAGAESALRRSLEIDPAETDAWQNLVRLLRLQNRHAEAREAALRLEALGGSAEP